jgi:DNA-binding transcriptional ArsR family regulator
MSAVAERPQPIADFSTLPYKELEARLRAIVAAGSDPTDHLAALDDHGEALMAGADPAPLLRFAADVDRLVRSLDAAEHLEVLGEIRGVLKSLLRRMDHAAAIVEQRADAARRAAEAKSVRPRVLELLASGPPLRSGDVARALSLAPSQVSRALRELADAGAVTLADPPAGEDGRARFYRAAATARAA